MATRRTATRRTSAVRAEQFDEQLWPINIVLFALFAVVCAVIVTRSDFHAVDLWKNGWVHLGTLAVTTLLFLLAAVVIGGPSARRFQLAALVSLLIHFLGAIGLTVSSVSSVGLTLPDEVLPTEPEEVVEFFIENDRPDPLDEREMEHEQPIDVPIPEEESTPVERETDPLPVPQQAEPTPVPEQEPEVQPNPVKRAEVEQAAPRRSEETSTLSRQTLPRELPETDQVPNPDLPLTDAPTSTADATASQLDRQAAEADVQPAPNASAELELAQPHVADAQPRSASDVASSTSAAALSREPLLPSPASSQPVPAPDTAIEQQATSAPSPAVTIQRSQQVSPPLAGALEPSSPLLPAAVSATPEQSAATAEMLPELSASSAASQGRAAASVPALVHNPIDAPDAPADLAAGSSASQDAAAEPVRRWTPITVPAPAGSDVAVNAADGIPAAPEASRSTPASSTAAAPALSTSVAPPLERSTGSAVVAGSVVQSPEADVPVALDPTGSGTLEASRSAAVSPGPTTTAGIQRRPADVAAGEGGISSSPLDAAPLSIRAPATATTRGGGPSVATDVSAAGVQRSVEPAPAALASEIALPELGAGSPSERPPADAGAIGAASAGLTRRAAALPVETEADAGVGGLGPVVAPDAGTIARNARRGAEIANLSDSRFVQRQAGGPLPIDGRVRETAEAFRGRVRDRRTGAEIPAETEAAVELGLEFLARHQAADGRWSLHDFPGATDSDAGTIQSDSAATGLALLAFLGAGYDHYDGKYKDVVGAGLEWLIQNQKESGDLYVYQEARSNESAHYYTHGIATISLCEAYGMTRDERLRDPAQRALNFIVAAQHPQLGGWRYKYRVDTDTSVTGWQVMALKSGELAGLQVPAETFERVIRWLNVAQAPPVNSGQYVYSPYARDSIDPQTRRRIDRSHMRNPTNAMTAAGLLMRLYTGWSREHPQMQAGGDYLLDNLPVTSMRGVSEAEILRNGGRTLRDTYYWYYATQVMYHMRGDYWKAWNDRLQPLLISSQVFSGPHAGSWNPATDAWGQEGGRIYVTAMNLLSLEVHYRHLPIHDSAAQ